VQNLIYYQNDDLLAQGDRSKTFEKRRKNKQVTWKSPERNRFKKSLNSNNLTSTDCKTEDKTACGDSVQATEKTNILDDAAVVSKSIQKKPKCSQSTIEKLLYPKSYPEKRHIDLNKHEPVNYQLNIPQLSVYEEIKTSYENRVLNFKENRLLLANRFDEDDESEDTGELEDLYSLPIVLRNCVLRPIIQQTQLVNRCAVNYFMTDLKLMSHFKCLRSFVLMKDGQFSQVLSDGLFEMYHQRGNLKNIFNPVALESLLNRAISCCDNKDKTMSNLVLVPSKTLKTTFITTSLNSLEGTELVYNTKWPCNIIVTASAKSKYTKLNTFFLKLKYSVWALRDIRTTLENIAKGLCPQHKLSSKNIKLLHIYRHEMHNFVKTMQGYVSTQILHVCWEEFCENIKTKVNNLEDLHLIHGEYVNKCLLRCLLTNNAKKVMDIIKKVLEQILLFRQQIASPNDDILVRLHNIYQDFKNVSHFLFKIVSSLVKKGYQPHLDDFLIRLNFNNFYSS